MNYTANVNFYKKKFLVTIQFLKKIFAMVHVSFTRHIVQRSAKALNQNPKLASLKQWDFALRDFNDFARCS